MTRAFFIRTLFFCAFFISSVATAQSYKWIKGGGSTENLSSALKQEQISQMCTDNNGNVYFLSIIGNDPITADTFHRPTGAFGNNQNVLFASYNCNGQMRFAKLISSWGTIPQGIATDNTGKVYLAVSASNGTSSGTWLRLGYDAIISGYTNSREALIQYDTSGTFHWIKFIGDNTYTTYTGTGGLYNYLAIDGLQRPHLIASTKFGVQLTPSLVSQNGYYDHTFNSTGSLLGVNKLNIDTTLTVYGVTIDKQSNKMYVHGYRDPTLFPASIRYNFLSALDLTRNVIWIDTFANPYYTGSAGVTGISTDGIGHLYVSVSANKGFIYQGDTAINVVGTATAAITSVLKLDTSGSLIWKRVFSSTISSGLGYAHFMPNNKIAACGSIAGGKIVSGTDTIYAYAGEGQNTIFTILDSSGYIQTLQQMHGIGFYDRASVCAADNVGNLYICGKVENNIWGGSLAPYTSVGGDSDYFIVKYGVDCSCTATPVANYTSSGTELTRNFTYTGTTAGIDSVKWYFGDGGTSTGLSTIHTYTGSGTYTTCVRVYTNCGSDMRCYAVSVSCISAVVSSYTDTGGIVHGFNYTGTSANYDSVVWNFGDGIFDTGMNVVHTYAVADTYRVCAKVYTKCDTNTYCRNIIVTSTSVVSSANAGLNIHVYPNPVNNELNITGIPVNASYKLMSALGASIKQGNLRKGYDVISADLLSSGIYLLEIVIDSGERRIFRIVKQ